MVYLLEFIDECFLVALEFGVGTLDLFGGSTTFIANRRETAGEYCFTN
jgi:hypothetical protein